MNRACEHGEKVNARWIIVVLYRIRQLHKMWNTFELCAINVNMRMTKTMTIVWHTHTVPMFSCWSRRTATAAPFFCNNVFRFSFTQLYKYARWLAEAATLTHIHTPMLLEIKRLYYLHETAGKHFIIEWSICMVTMSYKNWNTENRWKFLQKSVIKSEWSGISSAN